MKSPARAQRFDLAVAEQVDGGEELVREHVRGLVGILAAVVLAVGEMEQVEVPVRRRETLLDDRGSTSS